MIKKYEPTVLVESICKQDVVKAARESMELVITEGTGRPAFKGMPFAVAGKTGTAHVADGNIKYNDGVYQASFVGYFPANDPQYSCIVVIRTRPHAALHYGGQLGGPVFRDIATKLYAMYVDKKPASLFANKKDSSAYFYSGNTADIKTVYKGLNISYLDSVKDNTWANVYATNYTPVIQANTVRQKAMPNVKGMGLKDALHLLENMGVKVSVKGKGKIIAQSVAPGTVLAKGISVVLELAG
jgi:cell division protein FtsI (penicillin-binding protein 3)